MPKRPVGEQRSTRALALRLRLNCAVVHVRYKVEVLDYRN